MTAVLLFAKAPRPGVVKTRLAAEIGTAAALEAYRCVGRRVVEQVGTSYPITVWYDPPDALSEVKAWLGEHEFAPQDGADLGARLSHAFSAHLDRGDRPVIAIGADRPRGDGRDHTRGRVGPHALGRGDRARLGRGLLPDRCDAAGSGTVRRHPMGHGGCARSHGGGVPAAPSST